jgi:hypothetical protein
LAGSSQSLANTPTSSLEESRYTTLQTQPCSVKALN